MIKQSELYKKLIRRPGRKQYAKADVFLQNGTALHLTSKDIAESGLEISSATSQKGIFMLGAAVIGELNLILINHEKQFENYDFTNAVLHPHAGLLTRQKWDGTQMIEWVPLGVFTVDEAVKTNSTVTITALDAMAKFDRPYSESTLAYPATLAQILLDVCKVCEVALVSPEFYGNSYVVASRPSTDSITCREIIGYAAALCGCFTRCNRSGELEIAWYDLTVEPYIPVNVQNTDVAAADITVTGVEIVPDSTDANTVFLGADGYIVRIEQNPLAQENLQAVANRIGARLNGVTFRPYTISALSDPTVEAGDTVRVTDRHGTEHISFISNLAYSIDGMQTLTADAETQAKNQSTRFTAAGKAQEAAATAQKTADVANIGVAEAKTEITQLNGEIVLKASKANLISEINVCPEQITIDTSRLDITGLVTVKGLKEEGETVINGSNITTGKINADLMTVGTITGKEGKFTISMDTGKAIFNLIETHALQCYDDVYFNNGCDLRAGLSRGYFYGLEVSDEVKVGGNRGITKDLLVFSSETNDRYIEIECGVITGWHDS